MWTGRGSGRPRTAVAYARGVGAAASGAGARLAYPAGPSPYQVLAIVQYSGFQPQGTTSSGVKTIESKYLWHEVAPALAGGMKFGALTPFVSRLPNTYGFEIAT